MSFRSFMAKYALVTCHMVVGSDFQKSWDGKANFFDERQYQPRRERSSATDIVVGSSGLKVYAYSPDPREPSEINSFPTLRAFLKARMKAHIERNCRVSPLAMLNVVKDPNNLDIDLYSRESEKAKQRSAEWQQIVNKDIDESFRIRLIVLLTGL